MRSELQSVVDSQLDPDSDYKWIQKEFERICEACDEKTLDPASSMFRLVGALIAAMAKTADVDPFRIASGLADNADWIIQSEGQIPPTKKGMH